MSISDFEKGLLYGWSCSSELPNDIRGIINKICKPKQQFEAIYGGNDLQEYIAKASLPLRVIGLINVTKCKTLDDLLGLSDAHLLKYPNFGRKTLDDLLSSFKRFGLLARRAELLNRANNK